MGGDVTLEGAFQLLPSVEVKSRSLKVRKGAGKSLSGHLRTDTSF